MAACSSGDGSATESSISPPSILTSTTVATPTTRTPTTAAESPTSVPATSIASTSTTSTASTTIATIPPAPLPPLADLLQVDFEAVEIADFTFPTGAAVGPDGAFYVIGQLGPIWRFDPAVGGEPSMVLDLTDRTAVIEGGSSETGVLGIAFDPRDNRMFVHFTDVEGANVVASWELDAGIADTESERFVIGQPQPGAGHNGGGMVFDRAGNLFVGIGDGGASNGDDARDLSNFLGAILRIVPRLDAAGYDVPGDNPFVDEPDIADEIWAYGFRNPWRLFLDEPTGDLWVGDVGNATTEELDVVPADAEVRDFGWNIYEGSRQIRSRDVGPVAEPVHEWGRDIGYASIGGVVLRGERYGVLDGAVVFGDLGGVVMILGDDGVEVRRPRVPGLVSLNLGADGQLYGLVIWGELVRLDPVGA